MNDDDDATLLAALAAGVDITGGAVKKNVAASPPRDSSRGSEASPRPAPAPSPPPPTPPSPPLDVVGDGVQISGRYSRNARGWRARARAGRARRRLVTAASRGDAAIAAAAAAVSPSAPRVHARVVAGVKTKTRANLLIPIERRGDQTAAAAREWSSLRELFAKDDVALISHHKNHYALVFALRERCDADEGCPGGVRWTREMLTARRGSARARGSRGRRRAPMLGWSGYGILAATADRGGE